MSTTSTSKDTETIKSIVGVAGLMQAIAYPLGLNKIATYILLIQWLAFIPAYHWQTELFYDLTGSLTYIFTMVVSLNGATLPYHARQMLGTMLVMVWAFRLGYFLFTRILQHGKDSRFDKVKDKKWTFCQYWTVQALWVFLTSLPVLILNTKEEATMKDWPLPLDVVGLLFWFAGFGLEVQADFQKFCHKNDSAMRDQFIQTGFWKYSRHPNYAGEIILHVGIFIVACSSFTRVIDWGLGALGPLFVATLLYKVSLPMVEKGANIKWKDDKNYKVYMQKTPAILPGMPKWL